MPLKSGSLTSGFEVGTTTCTYLIAHGLAETPRKTNKSIFLNVCISIFVVAILKQALTFLDASAKDSGNKSLNLDSSSP